MSEQKTGLNVDAPEIESKAAFYADLAAQAQRLVKPQRDYVSNAANIAALLFNQLRSKFGVTCTNWAGFYFVRHVNPPSSNTESKPKDVLMLGPFMGLPAVVRIPFGRGVCGTCCEEQQTQLVPDVHLHPNHIACDSASESEVVVPVFDSEHRLVAVIDIDSPVKNCFTSEDQVGLEQIASIVGQGSDWLNIQQNVDYLESDEESPVCSLSKRKAQH